jgi:hypothetical protein
MKKPLEQKSDVLETSDFYTKSPSINKFAVFEYNVPAQ